MAADGLWFCYMAGETTVTDLTSSRRNLSTRIMCTALRDAAPAPQAFPHQQASTTQPIDSVTTCVGD